MRHRYCIATYPTWYISHVWSMNNQTYRYIMIRMRWYPIFQPRNPCSCQQGKPPCQNIWDLHVSLQDSSLWYYLQIHPWLQKGLSLTFHLWQQRLLPIKKAFLSVYIFFCSIHKRFHCILFFRKYFASCF